MLALEIILEMYTQKQMTATHGGSHFIQFCILLSFFFAASVCDSSGDSICGRRACTEGLYKPTV